MSGFFSANVTSPFPDQNALFDAAKVAQAGQAYQNNQLLMQGRQLDLTAADHEQVGRLAAGLLNIADPDQRAQAYTRGVGMLQSQGLAESAPPTMPDEQSLRMLVAQTVPAQTQAEWLANIQANKAYSSATGTPTATTGTTGAGTTGGVATAPSGTIEPTAMTSATAVRDGLIKRGMDPVTATAFAANKLHESGATLDSGPGDGGASQGNFMWNGDRNTAYQQIYGHTPQGAPLDEQLDFVMHELNGSESNARDAINAAQGVDGKAAAISRYYLRPRDVAPEAQRRSATALQLQRQLASTAQPGAPGGATAPGVAMGDPTRPDLAPPPPGGTAGIPSSYQATGGGIGAVLGGTARAARPVGPAGAPIVTDQPAGGGVVAGPSGTAVIGQPTPPSAAVPGNVGAINAGITRAGGTPAAAATPEPGWGTVIGTYGPQNQLAPTPPPAPTAPPATVAQPQAAPAGSPPPPQLQPMNANGLTPQQQAQIDAVASTGRMTVQQRMAAEQGFRNQNIQLQQKAFSDWIQVQQLQTSQGQLSVSQKNSALEYWKAAHPDAKVTMTGGEIITQDPRTGQEIAPRIQVTPQRADTAAMAIVSRLGPKVANGIATPEEQAQYAVAVDSYRQPVLRENPVTKETVRVNTRELPAGFPEPPSLGGSAAPGGTAGAGGSQVVMPGLSPAQQQVERDPAAYKVSESQYDRDSKEIPAIGDAGRQSQADQIRIQEMRDVLQRFNTGSGTEARTAASAFLQRWLPASLTGWEKESANLSGSDAAQAFSKLALTGAGSQERGVLGGRGGYQAIRLFKDANPNVNLQDATNRSILNMQLIGNQANQDYAQAALSHFADNEKKFGETHQYDSLAQFDRQWNAQKNPQVYAAAMGAIGGQDSGQWAKNLSADEVQRVKDIVARADPSAVIDMPGVGRVGTGTSSSTTQPTRIIHYDHTGKRISE